MQRKISSSAVVNIEDIRQIARRYLPRAVFDYLDGGAEAEITVRENCRAFSGILFRPRQAVGFDECDLRTRVLGTEIAMPVMLAPVGYSRLMHPGGEATIPTSHACTAVMFTTQETGATADAQIMSLIHHVTAVKWRLQLHPIAPKPKAIHMTKCFENMVARDGVGEHIWTHPFCKGLADSGV